MKLLMRKTHRQKLPVLTALSLLPLFLLSSCNGVSSQTDETETGDLTSSIVTDSEDTVPETNNKEYLTVILNTAGGNYFAPRKILKGKTLSSLAPVRQGYTFKGWYLTNGEKFDFSTPVTEDLHLVAYWQKDRSYLPLDTNSPVYETSSAAINIVWHDYDDRDGKRPSSVFCDFKVGGSGGTATYRVKITSAAAVWDGEAFPGGTLSRGSGNWTAKITGLDPSGSYSFTAEKPEEGYTALQSGTSAVFSLKGYRPALDDSARLFATNGRLYDYAGNLVILRGVVSLNCGYRNFPALVSVAALQRLTKIGVNCLRFSVQTTSSSLTGIGYVSNAGVRTGEEKKAQLDSLLETAVDNATKQGLYVIIDWGVLNENPNLYADEAADFFGRLAEKYKDNPHVIFEICNEPNDTWGTKNGAEHSVKSYEEKIIGVIRSAGAENIIVCAPNASATALSTYAAGKGDDPVDDPIATELGWNLAYTFHCYPYNYPWDDKNATSYGWKLRDALASGLTVVTTEMSPIKANLSENRDETVYDLAESAKFLNYYLENDLGFCYFRYNSSSASSPLSQWILFKPGVLPTDAWDRDDLTECGKCFYDIMTSDGIIKAADFNAPRHQ